MEEFKTYLMEDLIEEIAMGPFGSNIKVDCFVDSGVPVLNGANLQGFKLREDSFNYVTTEKADSLNKANAYRGDIVITHRGTLGQIVYIPQDSKYKRYVISQSQFRVRVNLKVALPEYVVFYFHTRIGQHRLLANASQVGVPAIARPSTTFKKVEIELPCLKEQKRIIEIINSLSDKIELNNRINHNLEEQAQALYKSWFVDFEPFKDREFVNSELGLIPKGWSIQPFFNIAKLCSGGTPKTDRKEFWNGSIPFFTPKDIGSSTFCLSTEKRITEDGLSNCNSVLYKAFTTFITARGTVGKICMAGTPMAMNQTNYAICPISYIDDVVLFLITKQLVNNLKNKANGAVFDAITTRDFNGEMVLVAPHEIMDAFSAIVHPIYECILQNEMNNASLSSLRGTLLPKIMSGSLVIHEINS